jgi:RNA polymerase sigma factor (sigma-70 family)
MQIEDKYIIQKCLDGETEAFGFLVDRYRQSVYAFAYSKLRNRQDAEDVTQKVFIKAYQKLRTLKQWDNMHAWLYSITANMCKDWIKIQSRRPDSSFIEDQELNKLDSFSTESHDNDVMIESLNEALESLPEIYRQVLTLYYLGDRDSKEIANFLGISPTSVRQRLARARDLLKEEMIAMMSSTFEVQRLPIGFTFRVVESIRRIKIDSTSIGKGVPWGLSLATGLLITILGLNPQFVNMVQIDLTNLAVSGESSVLETGDFPVDIAKISKKPLIAKQDGANNGKSESDNPLVQNAFFMAPQAEGGTWAKKADMPTARDYHSASVVNGEIYVIGGENALVGNGPGLSTVEKYDPANNIWTKKADMPTARQMFSTSVVNGKIYAIGGQLKEGGSLALTNAVEEYDPARDIWTRKADMPTKRDSLSTGVVSGKIYAIGGWNGSFLSTVEAYDPMADKWTKKADMPTARQMFSTSVVNDKIYAIGGIASFLVGLNTVEEYDPATDTWAKKTAMPIINYQFATCTVNNMIYVIGGMTIIGGDVLSTLSTMYEYSPATDIWTKEVDIPIPRNALSANVVYGKIYAIGGISNANASIALVDEYTPEGWQSISPQGKLPTKWGEIKR